VPGQGVVVEGVERQISPQPTKIHKNGAENGKFPALFGLKIAENAVFRLNVLNKIYSQYVF
jgi:hypothetical protein